MSHNKHIRLSPSAFLAAVYLVCIIITASVYSQPISNQGQFVLIGTHPDAAQQPASSYGRELRKLCPYNGKLYAAYGDEAWNGNEGTGPIAVTPYDPQNEAFFNEFTMPAEAIDFYVEINSSLYIPNMDHDPEFSSVNAFATGLPWQLGITATPFAHAYDITTLNGTDLYLVGGYGSSGTSAKVDGSLDSGKTWETIYEEEPNGNYARYYCAGTFSGKLYVQADVFGSLHPNSKVWNGQNWTDGPQLHYYADGHFGQHSETFAGHMVYHGTGGLTKFNGTAESVVRGSYKDFFVYSNILYYLQTDRKIFYTGDLVTWIQWGTAPAGASSLGILDGVLYIGTTSAQLYEFEETSPIINRILPGALTNNSVMQVYNLHGQHIKDYDSNLGSFVLSNDILYPSGVYIMKISKKGQASFRIIKLLR
jgi:hypothetical protein